MRRFCVVIVKSENNSSDYEILFALCRLMFLYDFFIMKHKRFSQQGCSIN